MPPLSGTPGTTRTARRRPNAATSGDRAYKGALRTPRSRIAVLSPPRPFPRLDVRLRRAAGA
ncbi:hypothetical protein, partial [Streptomyces javensis]|uniref:hypothetical protein n=1 Tax=Streptomyces javensis TaxID=114698 RepID=UPI001BE404B4